MPSGRLFRQERRQWERTQSAQARRQIVDARAQQAAARLRRARAEAEQRERQARQEAERRRAEQQLRQQQIAAATAARNLRRQQQAAQIALRDQRRNQALAAEALRRQNEAQERDAYEAMTDLLAGLPVLRNRCTPLTVRLNRLIGFLQGSGAAELVTAQADLVSLQAIDARCVLRRQQVALQQTQAQQMARDAAQLFAIGQRAALLQFVADMANDGGQVTLIDQTTTASFLTHHANLTLMATYPNLGLTLAIINDGEGPTQVLNGTELTRLNTKLQGHKVTAWGRARLPATRVTLTGQWVLIPTALAYFPYSPGAEVFHDWVWEEKVGHGQAASAMVAYLNKIHGGQLLLGSGFIWTGSGGKWVVTHPNVTLKIIFDGARALLITFYKSP